MYSLAFLGQASKSEALAIENGSKIVHHTEGPPMDWRDMPPGRPERVLTFLLNELSSKAGMSAAAMQSATISCAFAMSGLEKRLDVTRLDAWIKENHLNPAASTSMPLAQAGHLGAFLGKPGVLIRCGHGSCVFAIGAAGKHSIKGGWGGIVSDHGSGAWLGRQALISTLRKLDGLALASENDFVDRLVSFEKCDSLLSLVKALNSKEELLQMRKFLNHIGRTVCQLAADGDAYADRLILRAHTHLIALVKAAVIQLGHDGPLAVCVRGGIAETQAQFIVGLLARLCREVKQIEDMLGRPNGDFSPLVGVGLAALGFGQDSCATNCGDFLSVAANTTWGHSHLRTFPRHQFLEKSGGL